MKQQIHEICEAEVSQANIGNMELSRRHHMIFEGPIELVKRQLLE